MSENECCICDEMFCGRLSVSECTPSLLLECSRFGEGPVEMFTRFETTPEFSVKSYLEDLRDRIVEMTAELKEEASGNQNKSEYRRPSATCIECGKDVKIVSDGALAYTMHREDPGECSQGFLKGTPGLQPFDLKKIGRSGKEYLFGTGANKNNH